MIPGDGPPDEAGRSGGGPYRQRRRSPEPQRGAAHSSTPATWRSNNWHRLEFVVGRNDAALAEESEDQALSRSKAIFVAPLMRVTLLPTPISRSSRKAGVISGNRAPTAAASWQWTVKPLARRAAATNLIAKVEVLERQADGSAVTAAARPLLAGLRSRFGSGRGRDFSTRSRARRVSATCLGTLFSY